MEWVIGLLVFILGVGWLTHTPRQKKSDEAIRREKSGADYKPDPLAHLDVKETDRSITLGKQIIIETSTSSVRESAESRAQRVPAESDFEFEIMYQDRDGGLTTRRLAFVYGGYGADPVIRAFCDLANAERQFRSSRIISCKNLDTGRQISDLGAYLKRRDY